jgi:hypothetical protein
MAAALGPLADQIGIIAVFKLRFWLPALGGHVCCPESSSGR